MIILGVIILAVLAACVLAYFASRTWHWGYVIVVVGIVMASAGFFILSSEVLRANAVLRKRVNDTEKQITSVEGQIATLDNGAGDTPSIRQLEHQIRMQMQARGPVWRNVKPTGLDQQTGSVRVSVEAPATLPVANSVVYAFEAGAASAEDGKAGKQYLGEFRVTESAGQAATLVPTLDLTEAQAQRLKATQPPWVIYEIMPQDQHELFAGKDDEALRAMLPAESVEEYIRHGKAASADDEKDKLRLMAFDDQGKRLVPDEQGNFPPDAKAMYQRRLRDYAQEFRKISQRRSVMIADQEGLTQDNKRLADALASAKRLTTAREDEINKLKTDLSGLARDQQALGILTTQVQQQLDAVRSTLIQLIQENGQLSRQLAAEQSAAAASPAN